MEKLKNKHDHALTQWLKVIIFAILMLAPFFSVLSRCLYVTCNKNAKDSYSGINGYQYVYKYDTNEVNSYSDIKTNNIYTYQLEYFNTSILQVGNISFIQQKRSNQEVYDYVIDTNVGAYLYTTNNKLVWYVNLLNNGGTIQLDATLATQIVFTNFTNNYQTLIPYTAVSETIDTDNILDYVDISNEGTLDNAFEYSVNQLTQSQTFNWVTNTAIYQPVNAMTTGLGFDANNNIVALLLTYWAILTAVYVLFDIIISCFVKLTHLISGNS